MVPNQVKPSFGSRRAPQIHQNVAGLHLMSPQRSRSLPALPDGLVEEVLTRLPPDDPALLVRTALVSKDWCRLVSGPGFRRRFCQFHRTPPLLGYIYHDNCSPYFLTSSFRPLHAASPNWQIINARHGRFLIINARRGRFLVVNGREPVDPISSKPFVATEFIVWDPITDEHHRLPLPPVKYMLWNATLLCTAAGCDHSDCPWGPFLVVFVFAAHTSEEGTMSACVYSSEQGAWREPVSVRHNVHHEGPCVHMRRPTALVGNAVYFGCHPRIGVLEYDLGKHELSVIGAPHLWYWQNYVLMTAEDGGLGLASMEESNLCIWSRVASQGGCATWALPRVIELNKMLLVRDPSMISPDRYMLAAADDLGVVFIWADKNLFTIDVRSGRIEKVGVGIVGSSVIPYRNFFTPALGAAFTGEDARTAA
ncbi:unnamed protein product [Urochloa decumbens]|uniref:F-box domain-containing protein n=1 Tax=Urochloa decumbens TaxID=240449 RepID=A0ABC9G6X6_9POAL